MSTLNSTVQTYTIADLLANPNQPFSFLQFDPSLGLLQDVHIVLTGDMSAFVGIENLGGGPASVNVSLPGEVYLMTAGGVLLGSVPVDAVASAALAAFDGTKDMAGPSGASFTALSDTRSTELLLQQGLASFLGTGSVGFSADGSVGISATANSANLRSLMETSLGATVTLQYDYTPPDSAPVIGVGGGVYVTDPEPPLYFSPVFSGAVTTTPQTFSIADRQVGWQDSLAVAKFHRSLGRLETVNITLTGDMTGSFSAENLGASPASISATDTATITLGLGTTLTVAAAPSLTQNVSLAAHDGTTDFAGPSGASQFFPIDAAVPQQASGYSTLSDTASLAAFSGTGTLALPISSIGQASLSGNTGNLLTELMTDAGAQVSLSYTYLPQAIATDFNGDGRSDIVWQNDDGAPAIWQMNGTSMTMAETIANPGPGWRIVTTGDFDGDGRADILWQSADGTPAI